MNNDEDDKIVQDVQCNDISEDFYDFKDKQCQINDRFDEAISKVLSIQNSSCADQKKLEENIKEEFENLKRYVISTTQEMLDKMESNVSRRLSDHESKLKKSDDRMKDLEKRIMKIEEDESDSSESDDEDDGNGDDNNSNNLDEQNNATFNPSSQPSQIREIAHLHPQPSQSRGETPNADEIDNTTNFDTTNNNHSIDEGILILTDSMMKRIIEKKIAPNVKKEYVRGGTEEMINFIESFDDDTSFSKILIHTGTNDIKRKSIDVIVDNMKTIVSKCKSKWPRAKIILSGVIYHRADLAKNDIIDVINDALSKLENNELGVTFMDNKYITLKRNSEIDQEVFYDNIHLNNEKGIKKLAANIKNHLGLRQPRYRPFTYFDQRQSYHQERRPQYNQYNQSRNSNQTRFRRPRQDFRRKNDGIKQALNALVTLIGNLN